MEDKTINFSVAMNDTVTIETKEYSELLRRSAALDCIFAMHDRDNYGRRDYVQAIKEMLEPVITTEKRIEEGDGYDE